MANNRNKRKNFYSKEILIKNKLSKACLALLKSKPWSKINIETICDKANVNPSLAFSVAKDKKDILFIINDYLDREIYMNIQEIENSTNHDKIFEILMTRFEIYNKHRLAIIKLFNYIVKKPDLIIFLIPIITKSLTTVLEFSNIVSDGILGKLKVEGLLIIYLSIFLVWKNDESNELDKTMAAIDNHLNKAEVFVNLFERNN